MFARFAPVCLVCLCLGLPISAGGQQLNDLKDLQGTWTGVISEAGGGPPSAEEKTLRFALIIEGDQYRVFVGNMQVMKGRLVLDPSKSPKAIDTIYTEGPGKGQVQKGIYVLKGSELITHFTRPGDERPAAFRTRPQSDDMLMTYTKVKK